MYYDYSKEPQYPSYEGPYIRCRFHGSKVCNWSYLYSFTRKAFKASARQLYSLCLSSTTTALLTPRSRTRVMHPEPYTQRLHYPLMKAGTLKNIIGTPTRFKVYSLIKGYRSHWAPRRLPRCGAGAVERHPEIGYSPPEAQEARVGAYARRVIGISRVKSKIAARSFQNRNCIYRILATLNPKAGLCVCCLCMHL